MASTNTNTPRDRLPEYLVLHAEPQRRASEVDEFAFVFEQLQSGRLSFRRCKHRLKHLETVPPQLRHAVIHLRRTAADSDGIVQVARLGMTLHIALNAERGAVLRHQRRVFGAPIVLE